MNEEKDEGLLYMTFSNDNKNLIVGTESGFKVFSTAPLKLKISRILDGGIGIIEMLEEKNIFGMVGGGKSPKYSPNTVVLWNEDEQKILNTFTLTSPVYNIKLKQDKIIIVCDKNIFLFSIENYQQIESIETRKNELGIIGINFSTTLTVLGFPINPEGSIKIKILEKEKESEIKAHESAISSITINSEGNLVATASSKGTIIRVFLVEDGHLIEEFRRGKEKAMISCVSFDVSSHWMAVCSERGTVHVFSMGSVWQKISDKGDKNNKDGGELPKNDSSIFRMLPNFLTGGVFDSDRSFAQVRIEDNQAICAFLNNNIVVVTSSGKFYQAILNTKDGGECKILSLGDITLK